MTKPTERFSNRVDNYIKYRPGYPPAVLDLLVRECQLTPTSIIADIGFGTGLLARLFLNYGNPLFGVEPNEKMRTAGESLLKDYPNFTSIAAAAEATTLPDDSVDFVTAGQAFHWFNARGAYVEFTRILKPSGWVVLVWNERQAGPTPFLEAYEKLLRRYATEYKALTHKQSTGDKVKSLFGEGLTEKSFDNGQVFDFEGLTGRLLSSSYVPLAGHPNYESMLTELQAIFLKHQVDGVVEVKYTTRVYYCQLKS